MRDSVQLPPTQRNSIVFKVYFYGKPMNGIVNVFFFFLAKMGNMN